MYLIHYDKIETIVMPKAIIIDESDMNKALMSVHELNDEEEPFKVSIAGIHKITGELETLGCGHKGNIYSPYSTWGFCSKCGSEKHRHENKVTQTEVIIDGLEWTGIQLPYKVYIALTLYEGNYKWLFDMSTTTLRINCPLDKLFLDWNTGEKKIAVHRSKDHVEPIGIYTEEEFLKIPLEKWEYV